jgi:hypothetical protein
VVRSVVAGHRWSAVWIGLAAAPYGCAAESRVPFAAEDGGSTATSGLAEAGAEAGPGAEHDGGPQATEGGGDAPTTAPGADAGVLLYDGFESAAAGAAPDPSLWTVGSKDCSGAGTLTVDDTQAHGGHHSVRVDGGGGYCDHVFFSNASAIAQASPQVYARFFIRLSAPLGNGHVTFLAMKDQADGGNDLRMGGQDAVLIYNRQSDDATLPTLSPTGVAASVAVATSTWTCIELHVDEAAGTIETWVDGARVAGLVENGTPVADISTQWLSRTWKPSLVDFRLGWESYAGQTMTLWFDDVAIGNQRVGCGS